MTPSSFAALGGRLLLVQRFRLPMAAVVALSDEGAITVASAVLTAAERATEYIAGGAR